MKIDQPHLSDDVLSIVESQKRRICEALAMMAIEDLYAIVNEMETELLPKAKAPPRVTSNSWKPEDIALLVELADSGATLMRASAALRRRTHIVRKKAMQLGKTLPGVRAVRAKLRASGAIEPDRHKSNRSG